MSFSLFNILSIHELSMSFELGLIYGITAIGIYFSFRVIDFPDMTCDGSFVLGAAASTVLIQAGYPPLFALLLAMCASAAAGLATGLLHTKLKITTLLSGILVAFMLYSINLKVLGGVPNITLMKQTTLFTGHDPLLVLLILVTIVAFGSAYLLMTDFGLALRSLGQNKVLAQYSGIRVPTLTLIALMLSNSLIGLSGALFSQYQGFVDVSQGIGTLITGLAAVMIGERLCSQQKPWRMILFCLIGSILYRIFVALALHSEFLGLETQDLNLITGLLVIAVMVLPYQRSKLC
ncbi:MAG: hypothetical protein V4490_04050 [Pseudomonadota bacterium]